MKAVIGTPQGSTHQIELDETQETRVTGKHIGDEVDGSVLDLSGYTLEITGGSDTEGFPMRDSIEGTGRKKVLVSNETDGNNLKDGERKRKSVRGNIVSDEIEQLNLKVVEEGNESIDDLLADTDDEDDEPQPAQ